MKVFVATIPTYCETLAVATTEDEARTLAGRKAHEYLKRRGAIRPETNTPAKCIEYFGADVTECEIGKAVMR